MRRIPIDRDYIVIRIPKEPLRNWLRLIVILLVALVYPAVSLLFPRLPQHQTFWDAFAWWPAAIGYAVLPPSILLILVERRLTGAPPDGRFCALGILWNTVNILGTAAALFFAFKVIPASQGISAPIFGIQNWPFFNDPDRLWAVVQNLYAGVIISVAALWLVTSQFCDMFGGMWGPLYYLYAGIIPTMYSLLLNYRSAVFGPDYYRDLIRCLFPLAAGALLCIIAYIIVLDQDTPSARNRNRYYIPR